MWRLIIFLLFLIASVWLGVEIMHHPGYLLIVYQPWMVRMPVWFALLSLIIFFILFYLLIDSIDRIEFLWFRFKNWLHLRKEHRSYSKTQQGLAALIEGRFNKAEKWLIAGVNQSFEPLINYLSAARAAHEQGAYDRRERYIQKAYQTAPKANLAIGLTQAELEMEQGQFEQAVATLNHLRQHSPYHPKVLNYLQRIYVRLADWDNLRMLLPSLYKAKRFTRHDYELFEKNVYCEILNHATNKRLSEIRRMWEQVPRHLKKNPDVVWAYVAQLNRHVTVTGTETTKEIEELIRKILKQCWHPQLAALYGTLPFTNLNRQLVIVGAWVKMYGQQPELLFTLGRLCTQLQLWGKARDYFEKCLVQGHHPEVSLAYGKLLEQLGKPEEALQKYREGLQ